MTLILGMPTKGPLVFAPEYRRVTLPDGTYDDSFNKLVTIGGVAVASAYGPVRLQGEGSDVVRFDVYDIMRKFFANGVYDPKRLAEFEQQVAAEFADYRKNYRGGKIFKNTFRVIIYTWSNSEFRLNHRVFWVGTDGKLNPTGTNTKCSHGGIFADGDDAIITELISGHKTAFDDLRNHKDIKRFVINRQQQAIESVEPEEAIAFCKRLIALSNEYNPFIDAERNPVSKDCNLALLQRER